MVKFKPLQPSLRWTFSEKEREKGSLKHNINKVIYTLLLVLTIIFREIPNASHDGCLDIFFSQYRQGVSKLMQGISIGFWFVQHVPFVGWEEKLTIVVRRRLRCTSFVGDLIIFFRVIVCFTYVQLLANDGRGDVHPEVGVEV